MKAISCPVILTSIRTKSDGALGLSFATPELTTAERVAWMDLHGKNAKMLLEPLDSEPEPPVEVKAKLDNKSPSQRQRALLFLIHKASGAGAGDFDSWYAQRMSKACDKLRDELNALEN